jgi:hypothetical protein
LFIQRRIGAVAGGAVETGATDAPMSGKSALRRVMKDVLVRDAKRPACGISIFVPYLAASKSIDYQRLR